MRVLVLSLLALLVLPAPGWSLPEYAARENKACSHCHVDPGGGGPRNARGQYFEGHDHSFEGFDEASGSTGEGAAAQGPLQSLLETLSFSGNLKLCYTLAEGHHVGPTPSCQSCHARGARAPDQSFFLMQGELAVSARLSDKVSFVYANDLGLTRDVYAVIRIGESGAFVKAGAFEVPFGAETIKDHNSLVKARHNIGSNLRDVGFQVAVQKPRYFGSVAVLNGGERFPDAAPVLTASFDRNGSRAVAVRGGFLTSGFRLGGSVMFEDSIAGSRPREVFGGVFGTLFGNRWNISAEADYGQAKLGGSESKNIGVVAQAIVRVMNRLSLGGKFDWYDPDTHFAEDGEMWYTAIVQHEVSRNASVEARFRIREEEGPTEVANDDILTMLNVHF